MLIEKYTSNWIKDFAALKREIEKGLKGLDVNDFIDAIIKEEKVATVQTTVSPEQINFPPSNGLR